MLKIELLKSEDLKSYKELIDECFGTSNNIEHYEKYHENQAYRIFVVKDKNKIIGSAYHSISLTCLDNSYPAHRLYESVGFVKASSIKYHLDL